ncbi:MAG: amidase [Bacilli bacterium]|nr:amidase [Bacilli bacterium]
MNIKKLIILMFSFLILPKTAIAYNKAAIDITRVDISELKNALDLKIISSQELTLLYLDRIEAYDKNYNAIISINDKALVEAKKLDEERDNGNVRSILHGIPIIVKDNIDVLGMTTTAGAKALSDNYPKANADAIQKLIDAGAIILAKANMSEFAFQASSSRSSYGTVKNAYNLEYSAYGSSGGSATSVAASFATAALGTDTNSSVRLPAAASNLVGLRPTTELISKTGVLPYDPIRDTIGTLTKTVADSIYIMNIINQNNKEFKVDINNLKGLRIGIPTNFFKGDSNNNLPENQSTYSEIQALMEVAIKKLEAENITIIYLDDYYNYQTDSWFSNSLSGYLFCDSFNKYLKNTSSTIRSFTELAISPNIITDLSDYTGSCDSLETRLIEKNILKQEYKDYINEIMTNNNIDLIMYPTTKNKLLKNADSSRVQNLSAHASSTINYPAITLPLGFDKDNLPYGIEFMAKSNNEDLLYNIASLYENKNHKTPSIAPSLYEVPDNLNKLVSNYTIKMSNAKYDFEKKWLTEVQKFFRDYLNKDNSHLIDNLNQQYQHNKNYSILIKILIFFTASTSFLFIVRKLILKNTKPTKNQRKRLKSSLF